MPASPPEISESEAREALEQASGFIESQSEDLGLLAGLRGMKVKVGEGWAVNLQNGEVTVDPSFFLQADYRPEWCTYATMHELVSHLREVVHEPELTREVLRFGSRGKEYHTFHNVMADIAGNRELHKRLPSMGRVGASLYGEKLASEGSLENEPRHMQLLTAATREAMIPGSSTEVSPEVAEELGALRNFEDTGKDAIKAATDPARSPRERFELMTGLILPAYLRLLEQDKEDPKFQKQPGDGESGEGEQGEAGEGQELEAEGSEKSQSDQSQSGEQSKEADFSEYYDKINEQHPRPITEQEKKEIAREVTKMTRQQEVTPEQRARHALEEQSGHSYKEITDYRAELSKYASQIEQMEEFFSQLISRRLAARRQLSKASVEGVILDPSQIAQTHAEIQSGASEPSGLLEYEQVTHEEQEVGGYDLYLVGDSSGSMAYDNKSEYAADGTAIFLEGFNAFGEKIKEAEESSGTSLDLDVATSVLEFGDSYEVLKPLANELTERQRLDAYSAMRNAGSSETRDYLALEHIASERERLRAENLDTQRQAVITVITDGMSSDPERAARAVKKLRDLGAVVLGIGIADPNAEQLYKPDGRTISRAEELPEALVSRLENVLANREGGRL